MGPGGPLSANLMQLDRLIPLKIEFTFNEILYLALGLANLLNRLQNCEILCPRLEENDEQQVQQDVIVNFSFVFPVKGIP